MKAFPVLIALSLAALLAACAKAPAPAPSGPDAALLAAHWEQFIPVGSMPVRLTLDASGTADVDGAEGRWRIADGRLYVKAGGEEEAAGYTVSGYMLSLYALDRETSGFYINPAAFASGADGNASLAGTWAAWNGGGRMTFDGRGGLSNVQFTSAGDTELLQTYAARDGILQTADASGNYTYNLYSFSAEGALQLAETADYDSDVKQWTAWWKRADPASGPVGDWTKALGSGPSGGLPSRIRLDATGSGTVSDAVSGAGSGPRRFAWELYGGGFMILRFGAADLLYASYDRNGSVLYLGNPDVEEGWYFDAARYKPEALPLQAISGTWSSQDGSASVTVGGNTLTVRREAGEQASFSALAADGLIRLAQSGKTWYAAYALDGDSLRLYCWGLPVLGQLEMPVVFSKQ